jgi:parallel beta-helix repeat protein
MKPYQTKPSFLYIPIKRGDGIISKNAAPQVRMFNGMCSGYIDPEQWKTPPIISVFSQGETQWVEVPKTKESLEFAKEAGRLSAYDRSNKNFRQAALLIDPVSLRQYSQNRDFIFDFYAHKKPVPVLCLQSLPAHSIKESSRININDKPIQDVGQITEGTFLVGPGAGDHYPTFGGAGGGFAALGDLTANLSFTLNGIVTETTGANTFISLNNHILSVSPAFNSFNFNSLFHIISEINILDMLFDISTDGPGNVLFSNLSMRALLLCSSFLYFSNPANDFLSIVTYCFLDCNNFCNLGLHLDSTAQCLIRRNIIRSARNAGIYVSQNTNTIQNNTIISCFLAGLSLNNNSATVRNNYIADSGVADITDKVAAVGLYNATSDATGQGLWNVELGNLINQASAACISTAESSYADIIRAGPLSGAGQNTSVLSPCIKGRISPAPGTANPSIGAAELSINSRVDRKYW